MRLYERICGLLLGGKSPELSERAVEPLVTVTECSQSMTLVINRATDSFYQTLTDEEFVDWIRPWGSSSQVLRPEDREFLIDRVRAESLAESP